MNSMNVPKLIDKLLGAHQDMQNVSPEMAATGAGSR
jgi:hypothetical protein